ncbi:AraC family transcriptional regulator [Paenibacillus cymbidii]|uniref:AraC family transcriptional regulator n=1 Tax=Paenibacillus cymbidii TaxID=1639034 RepID=UPI001080A4F8|nr:AraC family transcriptional regulator [Paenibacillus cymbidii]
MLELAEWKSRYPIVPYVRGGGYAVRKPWFIPERRLLDYLLIYVQEGECLFQVDGKPYSLTSGDFCLIQPGSVVSLRGITDTITPYFHFDVFYNPQREASFQTRAGQLDLSAYAHLMQPRLNDFRGVAVPVSFRLNDPLQCRDDMLRIVACCSHDEPLAQLEAQNLASAFVLRLLTQFADASRIKGATPATFNWITSYVSFRLDEPLTVADLAERANLSPSRFSALFKREFGLPPHRYLLRLRIDHACELLSAGDLPLDRIAAYCGFADIHHFSKAFKRAVGRSPGAYRAECRSGAPAGKLHAGITTGIDGENPPLPR